MVDGSMNDNMKGGVHCVEYYIIFVHFYSVIRISCNLKNHEE